METLEFRIKAFLSATYGKGSGLGSCCGYSESSGVGYGNGSGYGSGYGAGYGGGSGSGNGYICGYGDGSGNGYGFGSDDVEAYGDGYGSDSGAGIGCGVGKGVKELNGDNVHLVDGLQTIIKSVHGNIAQGFILKSDLTLQPCYIVKENNKFAHGDTLHDAFTSLREKLYNDSTEEERIEAFVKKFPNYDAPYSNRDLFDYHHVLTGSCRMGRESFCKDKGINLDGSTTVREFVSLTKDNYGSETIRKLPQAYGVDEMVIMAWLAVDKDGSEHICSTEPYRDIEDLWCVENTPDSEIVRLPKGSIKKLIGRNLTWNDNPVELKDK